MNVEQYKPLVKEIKKQLKLLTVFNKTFTRKQIKLQKQLDSMKAGLDSRIAALERPRAFLSFGRTRGAEDDTSASAAGSLRRWLELFVLAPTEAAVLCTVCNMNFFRRICLPSSNGVVTAKAAAKMYSVLANQGRDSDVSLFHRNRQSVA